MLPGIKEYCLTESFMTACSPDEVIVMSVARFGRMRLGGCVTRNYGNLGCYTDVLYQVSIVNYRRRIYCARVVWCRSATLARL